MLVQISLGSGLLIFCSLVPTVTYTTLGYGDITLDPETRVFGSFAAITGLLTFGISTAFLISLLARMLPARDAD